MAPHPVGPGSNIYMAFGLIYPVWIQCTQCRHPELSSLSTLLLPGSLASPKNYPYHLPPSISQRCLRPFLQFQVKMPCPQQTQRNIHLFLCFYWLIWKKLVYYALLLTSLDLNILHGFHLFPWPCSLHPNLCYHPLASSKNTLETTWHSLHQSYGDS